MDFENAKRPIFWLLVLGNILFFVAALYSYIDVSSLREQLSETATARDLAMVEKEELKNENIRLKTISANKPLLAASDNTDLAKLEQLLDMRDAELAELKKHLESNSPPDNASQERNTNRNNRGDMQGRMERLKEENPEEYARIQNFREEMQQRNQDRIANRDNFFKNLDVSGMTAQQRETLAKYRDLLSASDELMSAGYNANRDLLRENFQALREMRDSVQDLLLSNLAESNGISPTTLSNNVKDIMEITGGSGRGGQGGGRTRR